MNIKDFLESPSGSQRKKDEMRARLGSRDNDFHWRITELPTGLHNGNPFSVDATKIEIEDNLLQDYQKYLVLDSPSDKEIKIAKSVWEQVCSSLEDRYSDKEMFAFYEFEIMEDSGSYHFILRYKVLE